MNDNTMILIRQVTLSPTKAGYFCSSENSITYDWGSMVTKLRSIGLGLDTQQELRFLSSPPCPDIFWRSPSLLPVGKGAVCPCGGVDGPWSWSL